MPFADVPNGIRIYFEEHGSGAPVLLLMGTGADHSFWGPQIEAYSEEFRLIIIDSRGTGQSTRPDEWRNCTPSAMASDAFGVLDHLGIERAHVGGLSLGSAVAQEMALSDPERLLSLALHGTWGRSDEWFIRAIDTLAYPALEGDVHKYLYFALMWVLSPSFLAECPDEVDGIVKTYLDENPHPPSPEGILGHTNADKLHNTLGELGRINLRTLVTAGEMDWLVPPRYGEEVARAIPGARYHLFRGDFSSHCACVEMADEWNSTTLAFLRGEEVGERLDP